MHKHQKWDLKRLNQFYQAPWTKAISCILAQYIQPFLIRKSFPPTNSHKTLSLGYTPAVYALPPPLLARLPYNSPVYGLPNIIEPSQKKFSFPQKIVQIDPFNLPFPDRCFDSIIIQHYFELFAQIPFSSQTDLLYEIERVLDTKGRLICFIPSGTGPWNQAGDTPFYRPKKQKVETLLDNFAHVGLSINTLHPCLYTPPFLLKKAPTLTPFMESCAFLMPKSLAGCLMIVAQKPARQSIPIHNKKTTTASYQSPSMAKVIHPPKNS